MGSRLWPARPTQDDSNSSARRWFLAPTSRIRCHVFVGVAKFSFLVTSIFGKLQFLPLEHFPFFFDGCLPGPSPVLMLAVPAKLAGCTEVRRSGFPPCSAIFLLCNEHLFWASNPFAAFSPCSQTISSRFGFIYFHPIRSRSYFYLSRATSGDPVLPAGQGGAAKFVLESLKSPPFCWWGSLFLANLSGTLPPSVLIHIQAYWRLHPAILYAAQQVGVDRGMIKSRADW